MVVLTMELRGTGVVKRVGDVAASPSSGLPRGPPRFRALLGRHRVSGESREGGVPVLTGELGGTGIVRTVSDVAAHPSSGLPWVPPLRFQASCGRPPSSFGGAPSVLFIRRCGGVPFGVVGGCGQKAGDTTSRCLYL